MKHLLFVLLIALTTLAGALDRATLKGQLQTMTPAQAVAQMQAVAADAGAYNPVADLLDAKYRPTLKAILAWRPGLAAAKTDAANPPRFPVSLAAQADDPDLVKLLLAAGAPAENDESDGAAEAGQPPRPRNSLSFAKSPAVVNLLKTAGARDVIPLTQNFASTESRVRVRQSPVDGAPIGFLAKGEKVTCDGVSALVTTINGKTAAWYRVTTAQKVTGWAWGGFLKPIR